MSFVTGDHSSISLYSELFCPQSHRIRMVLSEKDVGYKSIIINSPKDIPPDFTVINPSGKLPFFSDRDLTLSQALIICEYLDERFPHPPLMPVDPMQRAYLKVALAHIEEEWYPALKKTRSSNKKTSKNGANFLKDEICLYSDVFKDRSFFMSDDLTLMDCALAPIFWNFSSIGIRINNKAVLKYQERMFLHPSFRQSMMEEDCDLNPDAL